MNKSDHNTTIPTLVMFPILVWVYVRLARREEQKALEEFGKEYQRYMETTPAWIPGFNSDRGKSV